MFKIDLTLAKLEKCVDIQHFIHKAFFFMAIKKYYVVWKGHQTGIFDNWAKCQRAIQEFPNAAYKSYPNEKEAKEAFKKGISSLYTKKQPPSSTAIIQNSLSVDAACSGNPGDMEYRGVFTATKKEIFKMGPFPEGTNNIGEFLAIVHGLAELKKQNSPLPIYTDSVTALSWVKKKTANTKLERTPRNEKLFELIERAENWLENNTFTTQILKWDTKKWGEIPADFGRK